MPLPSGVERAPISTLKTNPNNARTHSARQIKQIAASMREFGFINPILIDEDNFIIAGHGRVAAARQLGQKRVPVVRVEHLSDAQKRAYLIADNQLALNAGWDQAKLAIELQTIIELDFEVELTGFETAQVDLIIGEAAGASPAGTDEVDDMPRPRNGPTVTQSGDLWLLGRHKLICGDARDVKAYRALMQGEQADVVFTDPPYNVPINGHASGLEAVKHSDFAMAAGEMSQEAFEGFLIATLKPVASVMRNGAIAFVCMDWRHIGELSVAGHVVFGPPKNVCVWAKTNAGMGSFYRSQHELVFVFKHGDAAHTNTFGLGEHGRYRSNLWTYTGANGFKGDRGDELAMHPTVKPLALVADAIQDVSRRGEIVLDPFGGSGTTLVAAHRCGRCARLIELDPSYCDVIVRRWQNLTGKDATLAATGKKFEAVAEHRSNSEGMA